MKSLIHLCDTEIGVLNDMDRNCYNLHTNRISLIHPCDTDMLSYQQYISLIHVILGRDKTYMYKIVDSSI